MSHSKAFRAESYSRFKQLMHHKFDAAMQQLPGCNCQTHGNQQFFTEVKKPEFLIFYKFIILRYLWIPLRA